MCTVNLFLIKHTVATRTYSTGKCAVLHMLLPKILNYLRIIGKSLKTIVSKTLLAKYKQTINEIKLWQMIPGINI